MAIEEVISGGCGAAYFPAQKRAAAVVANTEGSESDPARQPTQSTAIFVPITQRNVAVERSIRLLLCWASTGAKAQRPRLNSRDGFTHLGANLAGGFHLRPATLTRRSFTPR
jgi:hypothetical protein